MPDIRTALLRTELLIKRERSRRFGLLAYLAFARFIDIYRKYDPDQPRDDHRRWTDTGTGDDVDVTGSTTVITNEARTGDVRIDSITNKLIEKLADIVDVIPDDVPGFLYGTQVHTAFSRAVRESGIPGVEVEGSFKDGAPLSSYGLFGSIRTDVVLRGYDDAGQVIAVWDVKTGNATLGPSRLSQLRTQIGIGIDVPIIELSVDRGVMIKAAHPLNGTRSNDAEA